MNALVTVLNSAGRKTPGRSWPAPWGCSSLLEWGSCGGHDQARAPPLEAGSPRPDVTHPSGPITNHSNNVVTGHDSSQPVEWLQLSKSTGRFVCR